MDYFLLQFFFLVDFVGIIGEKMQKTRAVLEFVGIFWLGRNLFNEFVGCITGWANKLQNAFSEIP